MRSTTTAALVLITAAQAIGGCNSSKTLNKYFQDVGLNRLAVVRDDLQPGAFIVSDKQNSLYADSMYDYAALEGTESAVPLTMSMEDRTTEFNAVLSKYTAERVMEPKLALGFVQALLPVDLSSDFKFDSNVKVDIQNVKGQRLPIKAIEDFLVSAVSRPFRDKVRSVTAAKSGYATYVVYEVIRTNKLKITTADGTDINSSLKLGEIKPLSKAELGFVFKKTLKSEIELTGDHYYAFAVRVGALVPAGGIAGVRFDQLNFKVPGGTIKAVSDDSYSAVIAEPEEAVTFLTGPKALVEREKLGLR